ncbi:molybdopterin-binding protein [Yoonia vestfoldensis]|jgi:molybdenum cofactor cytidylyltransferase|uniref:Molybdopterin biosynthesis protein n=1 Tax=Yoonia vestfoldensis TaxID=245188 RepID=A0A1Y0EA37_9RHOB|nr:molybdopterin-binding protein [Yoonia vestfoldensis]ARU00485.1 molybdopterin biosynthesis protein [Yoonia vestfoldensis]
MKFGPVPVAEALGAILAHGVTAGALPLRKGKVLDAADIAALQAAGLHQVTVAQLGPGDQDENTAAAQLATALAGDHVSASAAATGRVNLFADVAGIVSLDAAAIGRFNAVNPMITLATLPPYTRIAAGNMIATIKIISYAVPGADVARAAATQAVLGVLAPRYRRATLIETNLGTPPTAKGRAALAKRLARFDVTLDDRCIVAHEINALSAALDAALGEVIFILTASATSDIADVGPAALRAAGGSVSQFGMPVDPGNLLFLGDLRGRPVIGLPGCARSPALNGADWVLERVICGRIPTPAEIAAMGVGGLLKEIPDRPQPRRQIG